MIDLRSSSKWEPVAEALEPVSRRAWQLRIDWILIGAVARDVLVHHYGCNTHLRASLDTDIAIHAATWGDWDALCGSLIDHEGAQPVDHTDHRFKLNSGSTLDIVPFGPLARGGEIEWRGGDERRLDVNGLEEASNLAITTLLANGVTVRVPTLSHLVALKLLAWRDRHLDRPRHDSQDLLALFGCLDEWLNDDSLYSEYTDVLAANDFDPKASRMECLGAALGPGLHTETRRALLDLLSGQSAGERPSALERELTHAGAPTDQWRLLLVAFYRGLEAS